MDGYLSATIPISLVLYLPDMGMKRDENSWTFCVHLSAQYMYSVWIMLLVSVSFYQCVMCGLNHFTSIFQLGFALHCKIFYVPEQSFSVTSWCTVLWSPHANVLQLCSMVNQSRMTVKILSLVVAVTTESIGAPLSWVLHWDPTCKAAFIRDVTAYLHATIDEPPYMWAPQVEMED